MSELLQIPNSRQQRIIHVNYELSLVLDTEFGGLFAAV